MLEKTKPKATASMKKIEDKASIQRVKDEEIHLTLSKYSANLAQTADELVKFANKRGGKDNTSIILVRIREEYSSPKDFLTKIKNRFIK